jgi:hypothetical protein
MTISGLTRTWPQSKRKPAVLDLANIEVALYSFHKMNDTVSNVIQGGLAILAGTAMLLNLEWVATFDQRCSIKVNAWVKSG